MERTVIRLADGWRFFGGGAEGAWAEGYDDSGWESVRLPHTWNALDGQDGGGDFRRGDGWYRLRFTAAPGLAGRQVYLQFDGVCLVSDVYLNGAYLGRHNGAFAAFRYDVTPLIRPGGANVLAVRANNGRNPEVAPYQADSMDTWVDFTLFGGVYRDVSLLATDRLQIDAMYYGSCGVFLRQRHVARDSADVEATVRIANHCAEAREVTLVTRVLDAGGAEAARAESALRLQGGEARAVVQALTIPSPRLWDGLKDPYLYRVVARASCGDTWDEVAQPLGLRYFHIDAEDGFFLNGAPYDLYGVSRHQDREGMGWALTEREHREDFSIIRELGCTFVRLAHYQHAQCFMDLCDGAGMAVWAELCLVGHYVRSEAFDENLRQQLRELLYQTMNHPSIVCWGLLNEISEPETGGALDSLYNICRRIDPTRPATLAMHGGEPEDWGARTDLEGHNKYFGWYKYAWKENATGEFAEWADGRRRRLPERKLGISEYGAGANVLQHEEDPGQPDPDGQWHPEEYQAFFHERTWRAMKARPYLWCKAVWNAFDFASDPRNEGARPGINDKGLVTYDRKIRKDAYYFYKANWSGEPFISIASRRFTDREHGVTAVKAYGNLPEAELIVNGEPMGRRTGRDGVFLWEGIRLQKGGNTVEVRARSGGSLFADSCVWNLK